MQINFRNFIFSLCLTVVFVTNTIPAFSSNDECIISVDDQNIQILNSNTPITAEFENDKLCIKGTEKFAGALTIYYDGGEVLLERGFKGESFTCIASSLESKSQLAPKQQTILNLTNSFKNSGTAKLTNLQLPNVCDIINAQYGSLHFTNSRFTSKTIQNQGVLTVHEGVHILYHDLKGFGVLTPTTDLTINQKGGSLEIGTLNAEGYRVYFYFSQNSYPDLLQSIKIDCQNVFVNGRPASRATAAAESKAERKRRIAHWIRENYDLPETANADLLAVEFVNFKYMDEYLEIFMLDYPKKQPPAATSPTKRQWVTVLGAKTISITNRETNTQREFAIIDTPGGGHCGLLTLGIDPREGDVFNLIQEDAEYAPNSMEFAPLSIRFIAKLAIKNNIRMQILTGNITVDPGLYGAPEPLREDAAASEVFLYVEGEHYQLAIPTDSEPDDTLIDRAKQLKQMADAIAINWQDAHDLMTNYYDRWGK